MQKMKKNNLVMLVISGIFSALSIILGKLLAFNIGEMFRISLENLPVVFMGIAFGPLWGAIVGGVADLVGCFVVGYTVNPFITLGAISIGAVAGIYKKIRKSVNTPLAVFLSVTASHIVGSILIKTLGLSWFYGIDFLALIPYRTLNYSIIIAVEYTIVCILMNNSEILSRINKLGGNAK